VLANEQVDGEECWRGHSPVRQKELDQWFLRITAYADELLEGLDQLGGWPEKVVTMQRNWIGRSSGVEIEFALERSDARLKVFTTRADTLFGCTFASLAVEHPLVELLADVGGKRSEVTDFVERVSNQSGQDRAQGKEGVFTGCYAINRINGDKVPVYLANFVLMGYGTGAVMAVPAHDQRDFEFAQCYDIDIRQVVVSTQSSAAVAELVEAYEEDGVLVGSGDFSGLSSAQARVAIAASLAEQGVGKEVVHYRLRDWGISRQRYWGAPIPIVYCESCGAVPVAKQDLPVVLPTDVQLLEGGRSPLPTLDEFCLTDCPRCGAAARRETDTMDTFVESSWYFLRYTSPHLDSAPFDDQQLGTWLPVSQYIGGVEHAVLHLLYSRFITRVLRDLGWLDISEPFSKLLTQGMVIKDGAKMSKSRGNVVDPDDLISRYGADTARLFSLFAAPPQKDLEWSEKGVEGAYRFLSRVFRMTIAGAPATLAWQDPGADGLGAQARALRGLTHVTIQRVTRDIGERMHFNTAIAAIMELVNGVYDYRGNNRDCSDAVAEFAVATTLRLLCPFVPHLASELWERRIGDAPALAELGWPDYDETALVSDTVEIALQVNGKLRSRISVSPDIDRDELLALALADERILEALGGVEPRKTIVVPGRLVNVVK